MSKLILIRHSLPAVDPKIPAREWLLSQEGRRRCESLASLLVGHGLYVLVASQEPKAIQTAQLAAERLHVPFKTAPDLHEQVREQLPGTDQAQFLEGIKALFERPDEVVFGQETANEASARFSRSVDRVLGQHPLDATVGLVTHGTVMTLYIASQAEIVPFDFWQSLGLPAIVVLDRATRSIEAVHHEVS